MDEERRRGVLERAHRATLRSARRAEILAVAQYDIPKLLAEVEQLSRDNNRMREQLQGMSPALRDIALATIAWRQALYEGRFTKAVTALEHLSELVDSQIRELSVSALPAANR